MQTLINQPNVNHQLSAQDYLDRYGVTTYLKDVITLVLENRPEDPIEFMADYFKNVVQGTTPLVRSYRYICLTSRNRSAFLDNLIAAYSSLCNVQHGNISPTSQSHNSSRISVNDLRKLVKMLCVDFPTEIVDLIIQVLNLQENLDENCSTNDSASVNFKQFASAINTCLLYEEFLSVVEELFNECGGETDGVLNFNTFSFHLTGYIRQQQSDSTNAARNMSNMPSEQQLKQVLDHLTKTCRTNSQSGGITFNEFVLALFDVTRSS